MKKFIIFLSCAIAFTNLAFAKYYSQIGQDKFVNEYLFQNKKGGVFVDIGANNGITISNTYFFEKELGWQGICVEPIPAVFEKLKQNRQCICIQACVAKTTKQDKFLQITGYSQMLSGLKSNYHPNHLKRIYNEIKTHGGSVSEINVSCYSLNDLLEKYGVPHINFLSIDTEGNEFEILKAFDFSKYTVDVICFEQNYNDDRFYKLLTSNGFHFVKQLEQDLIFVNNNFQKK